MSTAPATDAIRAALVAGGLDQIWPFDLCWLDTETRSALGVGAHGGALLVANSRALWPPFLRAVRDELTCDARGDNRVIAADPLERYVERLVGQAVDALVDRVVDPATARADGAMDVPRALFGHHGPPYAPLQRVAVESGFGWLAPSKLVIHAVFGPWVALRALIVGLPAPQRASERPVAPVASPCDGCADGCQPRFERVRRGGGDWRDWLAVRDACPRGRSYRYSDAQLRYHYTKAIDIIVQSALDLA